jgi:myo-inositol-1(or 4)-monophosphatase
MGPRPRRHTVNPLVSTALAAADAAVAIHRRDQGRVVLEGASEKGRADYVSRTDMDAQRAALEVISARHPDHQVLAEEDERTEAERIAAWDGSPLWVVDPLDGTANFLHGHPQYAASVGVAVEGRAVAGAVVSGSTGERWWASRGEGAFKDGRRIRVAPPRRLRDALIGTGFPFKILDQLPRFLAQLDRVLRATAGIRRAGAASLDLCYLAQGSLDGFWELILHSWDFAAGWVIIEEAGGSITKLDDSPLALGDFAVLAASTDELRRALGEILR